MRNVSGKVIFVILFLIFWGMIFFTGNWFPALNLPLTNDPLQNDAIRVLASFTFNNEPSAQNMILLTLFVELGIMALIWGWKHYLEFIDMTKYFAFVMGILWFFYWQFLSKYAIDLYELFKPFLLKTVISQLVLIVGIGIGTSLIGKMIQNRRESKIKANQNVPTTEFECPHCHTKYCSTILYCLTCKKEITSNNQKNK